MHTLTARTRSLLFATAGTAVVTVADLLDRSAPTPGILTFSLLLLLAAGLLLRARAVALGTDADNLVVHNLFAEHVVPVADVARVTATDWHTVIELHDGRRITSLLRAEDLTGLDQELPRTPAA